LSWNSSYDNVKYFKNPESFLVVPESMKNLQGAENHEDVVVFLVDAGEIVKCRKEDLLELPLNLITKIPF
jgi:hypothetical protein